MPHRLAPHYLLHLPLVGSTSLFHEMNKHQTRYQRAINGSTAAASAAAWQRLAAAARTGVTSEKPAGVAYQWHLKTGGNSIRRANQTA